MLVQNSLSQSKPATHAVLAFTLLSRYVLVTVGPVFTEEMWRLACCAVQDAFSATLEPVKVHTKTHMYAIVCIYQVLYRENEQVYSHCTEIHSHILNRSVCCKTT